ncbi:tRNA (N6-threonylcarbamoyladenosine(37)-N6)-methyltransferase TrmO [Falsibacillus albus]|uniref:tRNA (N6-threonylcarbamoyladenosine(37)-N6)-methyltransferase TrmO n=1 Tax=Falsibacillus albus TaxID=2478915 RepID=A0A3L7K1N2_9BACI|nr:tRNA (N6-threonylcarbamoyladenosine(37)-N6)-methyltransferase TrmO [Falsibacillus albus]RLQ96299.1 tRNA (N6-threonylcarbamoyladenosine(37)-N6)-methyltransferase TrmO [Falsibacillus albus]
MDITIKPIAYVQNDRRAVEDDDWGSVESIIELSPEYDESSLRNIEDFSHLEIIFYFNQVPDNKIETKARHPRNNADFPQVGIFAQRGKNRPNKLGLTTVQLLEHRERTLKVKGLDAIDGTPIIDIKPVMKEFLPKGDIHQPDWTHDIMKKYW